MTGLAQDPSSKFTWQEFSDAMHEEGNRAREPFFPTEESKYRAPASVYHAAWRAERDAKLRFAHENAGRITSIPVQRLLTKKEPRWTRRTAPDLFYLEAVGALRLDHDDAYVRAMVASDFKRIKIGDDFPVSDYMELAMRAIDLSPESSWLEWAVVPWVGAGFLSRTRVLRSILEAVASGIGNSPSRRYLQVYSEFAPSIAEIEGDQDVFRRMLLAGEKGVQAFALARMKDLHIANKLQVPAFLAAVLDVATMPAKNAKLVLSITRDCAGRDPEHVEIARSIYRSASGHPHRETARVASNLLGAAPGSTVAAPAAPAAKVADQPGDEIEPLTARQVIPFALWSNEDLPLNLGLLLVDARDPFSLEVALACLLRLDDVEIFAQISAVRSSARSDNRMAGLLDDLLYAVGRVVASSREELDEMLGPYFEYPLISSRVREIANWVVRRETDRRLLASPETSDGWLGALTLVDRLVENDARGFDLGVADFTAALFRLHRSDPELENALRIAQGKSTEAWACLAYALGGEPSEIVTHEWWVAAAQFRGDSPDANLIQAGLDRPGQGMPAQLAMKAHRRRDFGPLYQQYRVDLYTPVSAAPATYEWQHSTPEWSKWLRNQPTAAPAAVYDAYRRPYVTGDLVLWASHMTPRSAEYAACIGVLPLAYSSIDQALDCSGSVLSALQDSSGELGEISRCCVAFGMSNIEAIYRAQAAELFAAEAGNRLQATALASSMISVMEACVITRWASTLRDAASISVRGRRGVIDLLVALLPKLETGYRGVGALIETLDDALAADSAAPDDAALLDWLASFTGSSKSARAARSVLARVT